MRNPSLRQLEALMAVIESGTVSVAAAILRISQPAASKLIQDLEADTGLKLFERKSGRLVPTGRGMRLYEEVERIFGGVHQLARAVEAIRRDEHGHLLIGAMPALSGSFITRVISSFKIWHPDVFVSIEARSSRFLTEAVLLRRLDLALVISGLEHPSMVVERMHCSAAVAALPLGHKLAEKAELCPDDLKDEPFIAFAPTGTMRTKVDAAFEQYSITPRIVIEATTAPNVAELVAAGLGVTVADPLAIEFVADRIITRPFRPTIDFGYGIIRPTRARNSSLVADFIEEIHAAARTPRLIP
ncbi:LysR substrate-binding domain-containing protein (plasmid) [Agrobacterium vitis]|uniref:LysR substrate-binding domain-containing protein n=1 Tax=Agrobacterium vitis TaxID=373 RepID=UPI0012E84643|nr:LysR substrate-binding domain-containing protein [Agrobacterium vitis]MVA27813.1 LysR family transcriptional regulator [Agrobacterium vitis]